MQVLDARAKRLLVFAVAVTIPFLACSSSSEGTGSPVSDGGSDAASGMHPAQDGGGTPQDGASMPVTDSATPGPCDTYADKAFGCCSSAGSCMGTTRATFLAYCTQFYPGCMKFYNCYLGASTCTEAEACPTLGNGGCS